MLTPVAELSSPGRRRHPGSDERTKRATSQSAERPAADRGAPRNPGRRDRAGARGRGLETRGRGHQLGDLVRVCDRDRGDAARRARPPPLAARTPARGRDRAPYPALPPDSLQAARLFRLLRLLRLVWKSRTLPVRSTAACTTNTGEAGRLSHLPLSGPPQTRRWSISGHSRPWCPEAGGFELVERTRPRREAFGAPRADLT